MRELAVTVEPLTVVGAGSGVVEAPPTVLVTGTYIPGVMDIPSPLVSVQRRQVLSEYVRHCAGCSSGDADRFEGRAE